MLLTLLRIVLAGVSSSVGKTTITIAFIAHLRTRGIAVQPFKVGPDYIDQSHLALAAARPCYNLDTWMMLPGRMLEVFCRAAASADLAVIEGVMGLYDGQCSTSDVGSTAEVAKLLQAPVPGRVGHRCRCDGAECSRSGARISATRSAGTPRRSDCEPRWGSGRATLTCYKRPSRQKRASRSWDILGIHRTDLCLSGIWAWSRPPNVSSVPSNSPCLDSIWSNL